MIDKIKALFNVLRKGESVADPAAWKNRASAVGAITGFLVAVKLAAMAFGVDLGVTDAHIEAAVTGGASIVGLVTLIWANFATSEKVGLPAKKADEP